MFTFTEDMHEVSGLGGIYERACRTAVCAGAQWWAAHPRAYPIVDGDIEVPGVIEGANGDGRSLVASIQNALLAMDDGQKVKLREFMTHSMYYVVLHHVMWIGCFGWNAYVAQMRGLCLDEDRPASVRPS